MRQKLLVGLATVGTVAVSGLLPTAASAAPGDTGVTFTLSGGSLTLSTPSATATLSPGGALGVGGTTVSGQLGATTVTDNRATAAHSVTVTMASTDFTDGAGDTISKSNATAYSGVPSSTSGLTVTFVPTTVATPASIGNTGGATVFSMTGLVGSASATYNPTVSVAVPNNAVAGTYTGTVTQTVS